ncbi:MAG: YlbF family regulator [Thermacetogeniaceae bacterium]
MSYIEKAQELGRALLDCEETIILRAAEVTLDNDLEAQELIKDFQQKFKKIQDLQEAGEEVSEEDWREFNEAQEKVKANKTIQAYFAAQQNFQRLLNHVNTIINQVLRGNSCSSTCSGDCSGCM